MFALDSPPDMASSTSFEESLLNLLDTFASLAVLLVSASQEDKSTLTPGAEVAWLSLTVRFLLISPNKKEWRRLDVE